MSIYILINKEEVESMIWAPEIEQADRKSIEQIQLARLQDTVKRAYENVPFYRQKLDELGVKPEDIQQLSDVQKLPFTVKDDLRAHYPFGLLAVPMKQVNRIHASSGTTGSSTVVTYTKQDLENWSECIARLVCMAGGSDEDIAQIAFGYGLFTGGITGWKKWALRWCRCLPGTQGGRFSCCRILERRC